MIFDMKGSFYSQDVVNFFCFEWCSAFCSAFCSRLGVTTIASLAFLCGAAGGFLSLSATFWHCCDRLALRDSPFPELEAVDTGFMPGL